jgi:two-component system sensor histidine kinase BaeS
LETPGIEDYGVATTSTGPSSGRIHRTRTLKLNLFSKIFSAFMATILVAVIVPALVMYFSARQGFSEYTAKIEIEQLQDLTDALAAVYKEKQSWDSFKGNPVYWFQLLWQYAPESNGRPGQPLHEFRPPPDELWDRNSPFQRVPQKSGEPNANGPFPEIGGDLRRLPPLPPPGNSIGLRLALLDENKQVVTGPPALLPGYKLRPIKVDDRAVGWLGLMPVKQRSHPLELGFLNQQTRAILFSGLCALAFAGVASFFLARHFLAPIKKLTQGTKDLSALDFGSKIDVQTTDELGELAEAFNSMAKALGDNERTRRQWIADVAHELRTPLAILRGEIEAMQDGVRELTPERLTSLHDEANRMGKLVDDLHLLFIADSANLVQKKRPVNILEVLRDVLDSFETKLDQAGIKVEMNAVEDHRAIIPGDYDRLAQLFSNLIENAIRYTDSPGILRINHYCSLKQITLVFEDSAPGVPSEALDRVFDRLYRVDKSRSRALGGSGLGLSISKGIVAAHGGSIRAGHSSLGGLLISMEFHLLQECE